MRLLLLLILLLATGCRTTDVFEPPPVPPDATTLVLSDDESPRVLYATAWGAFAESGWDIVDRDSDAFRLTARPKDSDTVVEVVVEPSSPRAIEPYGRIVANVDPTAPNARAVFEGATAVLARLPGRITFR